MGNDRGSEEQGYDLAGYFRGHDLQAIRRFHSKDYLYGRLRCFVRRCKCATLRYNNSNGFTQIPEALIAAEVIPVGVDDKDIIDSLAEVSVEFPYLKEIAEVIPVFVTTDHTACLASKKRAAILISEYKFRNENVDMVLAHELLHIVLGHTILRLERLQNKYDLDGFTIQMIADIQVSFYLHPKLFADLGMVRVDRIPCYYSDLFLRDLDTIASNISCQLSIKNGVSFSRQKFAV